MPRTFSGSVDTTVAVEPFRVGAVTAEDLGRGLRDLQSRVQTARLLVPINNWDFAERVWTGLRPQLRSRLSVLESLFAVPSLCGGRSRETWTALDRIAREIHEIETEFEAVLGRRGRLSEFSVLLERRLTPCLCKLEQIQDALNEPDES